MALKSTVFKQSIKKVGYWNYKDLYGFIFGWLRDNGYSVKESEYTEKNSDFGKEISLSWEANKKVTDYFKNVISLRWSILGMNDVQIERAGKVEKTNKGEVKIEISADLVKDYDDKWETTMFNKMLRGFYDNYIIRSTTDEYEGRASGDARELVSQVKSFLEL